MAWPNKEAAALAMVQNILGQLDIHGWVPNVWKYDRGRWFWHLEKGSKTRLRRVESAGRGAGYHISRIGLSRQILYPDLVTAVRAAERWK